MASWRKLLAHRMRLAASRVFCTAGSKSAISTPMMAMTTSSSTSVNARRTLDMVESTSNDRSKERRTNATSLFLLGLQVKRQLIGTRLNLHRELGLLSIVVGCRQ